MLAAALDVFDRTDSTTALIVEGVSRDDRRTGITGVTMRHRERSFRPARIAVARFRLGGDAEQVLRAARKVLGRSVSEEKWR